MANLPIAAITTLIYGILSIVGGAMGYQQASSKVSLISGLVSGLLLLIGAYLLFGGMAFGPAIAAIVTLLLVVVFAVRLFKTRKFMPAGLMMVFGLVNLASLWISVPVN
jgi:uncharacterized membrane protein (UPF0136 family)